MSGSSRRLLFCLLTALAFAAVPVAGQQRGEPGVASRTAVVNVTSMARQEALSPDAYVEEPPAFVHSPQPMPRDLPVPEGAKPSEDASAAATQGPPLPAAPSPALAAGFLASTYSASLPPDVHGAVGPNHLLVTHNNRLLVQNKAGALLTSVTLRQFWSALGVSAPSDVFDPRAFYDPSGQRFILVSSATRRSPDSSVLVGVSQTSDPTGNWFLYRVDADPADESWADYPSVGFNKNWVVVQMNMFDNDPDNPPFVPFRARMWAFDKPSLYAGGGGAHTVFTLENLGGTMSPAVTLDPNVETLHVLQNWNGNLGTLRHYTITPSASGPVINFTTTPRLVSTASPWASGPPAVNGTSDFAPQTGAAEKIQVNDARVESVVYRNGSLWCAHTVFLPAGAATRSAVQWWQINADAAVPTVLQRGRIDDASGTNFYGFASLAVNKNNDVLLGYSRFRADSFAHAAYSFRAAGDPAGTTRDEAVLKAGEDFYVNRFDSRNRWGDYSATVVDPSNDADMWTIQEYAAPRNTASTDPTRAGRWATWWGKLELAPVPASVRLAVSGTQVVSETAGQITLSVTRGGDTSTAAQIDYTTSDGTASERTDYSTASGTLTFAPGETQKSVTVFITDDAFVEPAETFSFTLSNPRNCVLDAPSSVAVQVNSNDLTAGPNPVRAETFNPSFFVAQHYRDFLNRDADAGGLAFWTNQTTGCGNADLLVCRINVSAAFFLSPEFQETGFYAIRAHRVAFGRRSDMDGNRVTFARFIRDARQVGEGFVDGQPGAAQVLESNKNAYAAQTAAMPEFIARFPASLAPAAYVDALYASAGVAPTSSERQQAVDAYNSAGGGDAGRAAAFRKVADSASVRDAEFRGAFVLMQYFGYMRRDPDQVGYSFWLGKLNEHGGNYITAEMVKSFLISGEYQERFGP